MEAVIKPGIRELVLQKGFSFPTDQELIMLILGSGMRGTPVDKLADQVVSVLDDSNDDSRFTRLRNIKGIGDSKALAIEAALEIGRRRSRHLHAVIRHASDAIPFLRNYSLQPKEHMVIICLNGAHEIISLHIVSIGTKNQTLVHPREIFSVAIEKSASALILCHNHPDGNCSPSPEDIETTRLLIRAGNVMGVPILDHIIIDRDNYFSFMENNLLFPDDTQ